MQLAHVSLPYAYDALEPYMSREALEYHHGSLHRAYVNRAKEQAKAVRLHGLPLEQIILMATRGRHRKGLLQNAAEAWNHAFFWRSLRPGGGGAPSADLADRIASSFGSYGAFRERFVEAALAARRGGWVWLVLNEPDLAVLQTSGGETPIMQGLSPLMTLDVRQHAYRQDYRNRRADYVKVFLDHLVNWDFARRNLARPRFAGVGPNAYGSRAWKSAGLLR